MSLEHNKAVKPGENQNFERTVNKSRRSFSKAGMVAPVIMTLASKSALGSTYQCTISGAQSGNTSTHPDAGDVSQCAAGFSPVEWKDNASSKSAANGNIDQWCQAGIKPYAIKTANKPGKPSVQQVNILNPKDNKTYIWIEAKNENGKSWKDVFDSINSAFGNPVTATTFDKVFLGSDIKTPILEVLLNNQTSLEAHAIADYLNAALCLNTNSYFLEVYKNIHPSDIVNLYFLAKNPNQSFVSYYSHRTIDGNFNGGDIAGYLAMIHT